MTYLTTPKETYKIIFYTGDPIIVESEKTLEQWLQLCQDKDKIVIINGNMIKSSSISRIEKMTLSDEIIEKKVNGIEDFINQFDHPGVKALLKTRIKDYKTRCGHDMQLYRLKEWLKKFQDYPHLYPEYLRIYESFNN